MSSGSLISSLFRDNSFSSRSTSLFQKSFGPADNLQQRTRSQSTYLNKNDKQSGSHKYLPVARMVHMLARKLKTLDYFLFCRLQANYKKYKTENPKSMDEIPKLQLKPIESCSTIQSHSPNKIILKSRDKGQAFKKGLENMLETIHLAELKHHNLHKVQIAFNKIKVKGQKFKGAQRIFNNLTKARSENFAYCLAIIQQYEKFILRSEIFVQASTHVLQPKVKNIFNKIRNYALEIKIKKEIYETQEREKPKFIDKSKPSTKIQSHKSPIALGKAYKVETSLIENRIIILPIKKESEQFEFMQKLNKLYNQSIIHPLPDLHDNMGVFEHIWSGEGNTSGEDFLSSNRTVQKTVKQSCIIQNQRTIGISKLKRHSEELQHATTFHKSINQSRIDNSNISKESKEYPPLSAHCKSFNNGKSIPKNNPEAENNTSNYITGSFVKQTVSSDNDQFYSSPLEKIQQMMMDLERLREQEKYHCKYTTGYQKCKISVNLPTRKSSVCQGKSSYQGSANKIHHGNSYKNTIHQCKSQKKELNKDQYKKYSYKQNNEPKDNIQVKLWNQKNKFLFYTDSKSKATSKEKRKSSGIITSMTQSQINTARKMKKQIESIINSRKNRTSLGDLKLVRNKY